MTLLPPLLDVLVIPPGPRVPRRVLELAGHRNGLDAERAREITPRD